MSCVSPFISPSAVSGDGGYIKGRFCGNVTGETCCLPCPVTDWVYSDNFNRDLNIAYWFNVPALVLQVFLLVTFLVLPEDVSHRHYLSVGLVLSLMMFQLAFVVPLGSKPEQCYDAITPKDMYSSMSCAWTGALVAMGGMGGIVWVLLRSLWTHLRVCWDVHESALIFWLFQVFGWGLPGLFLALTMGVTGVSYRIGTTCLPNQKNALVTWIGWLMAFACTAAVIQFVTTAFCLWLYIRQMMRGDSSTNSRNSFMSRSTPLHSPTSIQPPPLAKLDRRMAWRRVRRVMKLQWRSIALTILGIIVTAYFAAVFVNENEKITKGLTPSQQSRIVQWTICYLSHNMDKTQCEKIANIIGLNEAVILTAFYLLAVVGIFTFLLMARRSMFLGWYQLLRDPKAHFARRTNRPDDDEDFVIISPIEPTKRKSVTRELESERRNNDNSSNNNTHLPVIQEKRSHVDVSPPVSPMSPQEFKKPKLVIPRTGEEVEDAGGGVRSKKRRSMGRKVSRVNEDDLA